MVGGFAKKRRSFFGKLFAYMLVVLLQLFQRQIIGNIIRVGTI